MTTEDLRKKYNAVFAYHFIVNGAMYPGKSLLAGTYAKPAAGGSAYAYVPALDDFAKILDSEIVATIRVKQFKSKI